MRVARFFFGAERFARRAGEVLGLGAADASSAAAAEAPRLLCHWALLSLAIRAIERRVRTDESSWRAVKGFAGSPDLARSHIGLL